MKTGTIYKVVINYKGKDGYGYGTTERATKEYTFDSLEEAQEFCPKITGKWCGHGVSSTLYPTKKTIYKITTEILQPVEIHRL